MPKESVLKKLKKEQAQAQRQLEQAQHKQQQLQNRLDYSEDDARRERTHRLVTRGAAIEHIVPEISVLDEKSFFMLMADILIRPEIAQFVRSYLASHATGE